MWKDSEHSGRARAGGGGGGGVKRQSVASHAHYLQNSTQSAIDFSHQRAVTDLHWMPYHGEVNSKGTLSYENAGEKVTNQFLSIAGDGMVLFWDLRVRDRKKQPRRSVVKKDRDGDQDLWAPIYSIKLTGLKPSGGAS